MPTFHITIAYVKKGVASKYTGDTRFDGTKLTFSSLTFSPAVGDKTQIPLNGGTDSVYTPNTMTIKAGRVKIPAGLQAKAKELNYPKATITLSDGRTIKDVTVFNGEELGLDKDLDLEGVVITDMNPQMPPQIDDSPAVHPHVDDKFPTETPEKQADNAKQEAIKDVLRNMPYTDALFKHLEAAARILQIIADKSGVSSTAAAISDQNPSTMKLEDLKQLEAKVKSATDIKEVSEAFAGVSIFAEAIMKESEKFAAAAKDAEKAKQEAEATAATIKADLAEAKKTLKELQDAQASAAAEASFQNRMTAVNAHFNLDDDVRAMIVEEIRACATDEVFSAWFAKAKKIMKGYVKAGSQDVTSVDTKDVEPAIKHGDKDTVDSLSAKKADKKDDKTDDDDDKACMSAKTAIASAKDNPTDKTDIDTIGDIGGVSLMDRMQSAFASNTSVGGKKVKDFVIAKK